MIPHRLLTRLARGFERTISCANRLHRSATASLPRTAVLFLAAAFAASPAATAAEADAAAVPASPWELVWSDEFTVDGLPDEAKWGYDVGGHGWGNRESQFYTERRAENARVEDGVLIIEARHERWEESPYTSARLVTNGHASWMHGRFEIKARVPAGLGTWSALWMLPVEWTLGSGHWPDVGEIDIMEHVGSEPGKIHASAHSRDYQWQIGTQKTGTIDIPDATTAFHVYSLEWSHGEIRAYVDDRLFFTYKNEGKGWTAWPYERPFYLILNVAVGGTWGGAKGIDDTAFPQRMEIDYVRVYTRRAE